MTDTRLLAVLEPAVEPDGERAVEGGDGARHPAVYPSFEELNRRIRQLEQEIACCPDAHGGCD